MSVFDTMQIDEVGVPEIDIQHKQYIDIVGRLKDIEDGKFTNLTLIDVLEELIHFSVYHFKTEENLMIEYAFPEVDEHTRVHAELMDQLYDSLRDINLPTFDIRSFFKFIHDWITEHTMVMDSELAKFIIKKRSADSA